MLITNSFLIHLMRYKPGHREQSRQRILQVVGQGFRTAGYTGIGVDGLAKAAGMTSGAFYGHFHSKAEAFRAAVVAGLVELRSGVENLQCQHGNDWVDAFVEYYLSQKVTCPPAEACALPSLSPEVARADKAARVAYQKELLNLAEAVTAGLPSLGKSKQARRALAWALLAQLAGAVMLARAVSDNKLASEIAGAVKGAIGAQSVALRKRCRQTKKTRRVKKVPVPPREL
jgi:TetR/AcrR family transcriptional regulator, transcriptional repressor for nem operon